MKKSTLAVALGLCAAASIHACNDDPKRDTAPDGGSQGDGGAPTADGGPRDRDASADGGNPPADAGRPPTPCDASAAPTVPALRLRRIYGGLEMLVFAAQPKGTNDWYLVRQTGEIMVSRNGAAPDATPFLDVSDLVSLNQDGEEWGLLGLAFAPDYATSGRFYIGITPSSGPDAFHDMVVEYRRSAADPYRADPSTRRVIVSLEASSGNHNGGHIAFGPDGMLYMGTGDGGGSCNDNKPNGPQDRSSLFGKILRLDPNAPAPHAASGNPFSGAMGDPRVLHYGLRNPFRFNFDFETGHLYIGDVGQNTAEELSFAPADAKGLNFGWAAYEGKKQGTCGGRSLAPGSTYTPPIFDADRTVEPPGKYADYVSIIAGHVYRGSAIPQLAGAFLFGDYLGDVMGLLRRCGDQTSAVAPLQKRKDPNSNDPGFTRAAETPELGRLTAIVEDSAGELYMVANQNSLLKVEPAQ